MYPKFFIRRCTGSGQTDRYDAATLEDIPGDRSRLAGLENLFYDDTMDTAVEMPVLGRRWLGQSALDLLSLVRERGTVLRLGYRTTIRDENG